MQTTYILCYRRNEEALKVLEDYKKRNDGNPSSYQNLIAFHRYHGNQEAHKQELIGYCKKWPSDRVRCLDLIDMLDLSCAVDRPLAVGTFFSLMDYSCYRYDVSLWNRFRTFIQDINDIESDVDCSSLSSEWVDRQCWWMPFHFNDILLQTHQDLSRVKQDILKLLNSSVS